MEKIKDDMFVITQLRNSGFYELKHHTTQRLTEKELREIHESLKSNIGLCKDKIKKGEETIKNLPDRIKKDIGDLKSEIALLSGRFEKLDAIVSKLPKEFPDKPEPKEIPVDRGKPE